MSRHLAPASPSPSHARSILLGGLLLLGVIGVALSGVPAVPGPHAAPSPGEGGKGGSTFVTGVSSVRPSSSVGTIVTTIPVQNFPDGIAFDSSNGHLFVANANSNNLQDINGATNTVTATIPLPVTSSYPANPGFMAFDSSNGYVYVGNTGSYSMSVINGANDANVSWLQEPQGWDYPYQLALDTTTGILYFTNGGAGITNSGGTPIYGISGLNPSNNQWGYAVETGDGFSNGGIGICFDSSSGNLYVSQSNQSGSGPSNIVVIAGGTDLITAEIPTTDGNVACTYDGTSNQVFDIAGSQGLLVINPSTNQVTTSIAGLGGGYRLAFDSANGYVYEANSSYLTAINGATDQEVGTLAACGTGSGSASALDLAVDSSNGDVYVVCQANVGNGYVAVVNPSGTGGSGPTITSFGVSPSPLPLGGTTFVNLSAAGGTPPYTYGYAGLPQGCVSANVPSLACVPTAAGSYSLVGTVTDSAGKSAQSSPATLTVNGAGGTGTLTSVAIAVSPSSTVSPGGSATLAAQLTCSSGGCPNGATYSWSLSPSSLGSLSSTTMTSVVFTAGTSTGSETVQVTVTLGGVQKTATTTLTIGSPSSPSSGSSGGSGLLFYGLVLGAIAVVAIVGLVVVLKVLPKRRVGAAVPPARPGPVPPVAPPPTAPGYPQPPPR